MNNWRFMGLWRLALIGFAVGMSLNALALAWDGDWTDAHSGRTGLFENPGSTDGQAGTDPPQKYYTAAPRDYSEVDPEELDDYFHRRDKNYTPYALARVDQDLHYNQLTVPKGYYLIKPGDAQDGSERVKLNNLNGPPLPDTGLVPVANAPNRVQPQSLNAPRSASPEPMPAVNTPASLNSPSPGVQAPASQNANAQGKVKVSPYEVLVIKRQGKVVMVVPIHRRQMYIPARKDKIPNRALAWVEEEDRHPVLKFYFHHWIYATDFQ